MSEDQVPVEDPGKEFLGKTKGMRVQEKYELVCRLLGVQKQAAQRNDEIINKLNNEVVQLKGELRSTQNHLEAAQQMALISGELSKGHIALEEEVHRLRGLCKANGINPEG